MLWPGVVQRKLVDGQWPEGGSGGGEKRIAKAEVGEEVKQRQRQGASEDLGEDVEEESEPIHHCSPDLQGRRHVQLCRSHVLGDRWPTANASGDGKGAILVNPSLGGRGRRFRCST